MKDIRVNNRTQRVFVLLENDKRIVYIPLNALHRVDYQRLLDMEAQVTGKLTLMDVMRKKTLDNGINALVQYDTIIQVFEQKEINEFGRPDGTRLPKPNESYDLTTVAGANETPPQVVEVKIVHENLPTQTQTQVEPIAPARRKPGPKPKVREQESQ